jgi:proteasome lid subunit RPN8/RPN11
MTVSERIGERARVLTIPQTSFDEMLAHLRGDLTEERCGLLAGEDGRVTRVLPVPNALRSPVAYRMDGPEFIAAMAACDFEPLAIYHSHLAGPPIPSATDVAEATYPDSIYVIVSFHIEPPSVRAFRIVAGQVTGVVVQVE